MGLIHTYIHKYIRTRVTVIYNSTYVGFPGLPVTTESPLGVGVSDTSISVLNSSLTTVFIPLIYIIIFIVGLPTNAMAIWVFLFRIKKKKKNPMSILLANLALADLLFIIWLPLKIHYHFNNNNWIFGEPLCKVLVAFISIQRYWAVAHPLSHKLSNRVAVCVSVCVWIVVWITTIPLYLYDQTVQVTNLNITTCHDVTRPSQSSFPVGYFLTMGIVGYVVPCLVCVVAYLLTFCSLRKSAIDSSSSKKKKKAIILMIIVVVMFLLCFTPSNIMLLVHYSLLAAEIQNETYSFYIVALCLGSLNSCLDPFVYYFISDEFREHVKNTLKCRSERSAERIKVSFTHVKSSSECPTLSTFTPTGYQQSKSPLKTHQPITN
uniref:Coagulation factor II (thrombin) receptor-like 1, tandem duplicate 1 n=1 Tax=Astyanax mexicanus TaxID=7994 RepID=A0A3B1KKU7_ASTMX